MPQLSYLVLGGPEVKSTSVWEVLSTPSPNEQRMQGCVVRGETKSKQGKKAQIKEKAQSKISLPLSFHVFDVIDICFSFPQRTQ